MIARLSVFAALVALSGACGQDLQPPTVRNFDRPTSIGFACFGDMLLSDGTTARTAQPLAACTGTPEGQEDLVSPPILHALVLETGRGTVDMVNVAQRVVLDSDPLSPGKNDIPLGSLPVGLVSDQSACYAVSANAGSCDLSSLDITSALDFSRAAVARVPVLANGEVLRAKPRAIVAPPQTDVVGNLCPDEPEGIAYVAYPSCDLVAAIDLATGEVVDGIVYRDDGSAERATAADFACPVECGDGALARAAGGELDGGVEDGGVDDGGIDDGGGLPEGAMPGRPVTLALHTREDGSSRLFVGGEDSPLLTIVELGADDLPTGVIESVVLEGDVGITNLAVTDRISMGGDVGSLTAEAGEFQFAYVITTDSTVRVVDLDRGVECDTQVDPRFLHDEDDYGLLACMPVGDPATPPRRVGARSPGIHVPGNPTAVAFATVPAPSDGFDEDAIIPQVLVGTFAFITSGNGSVWVVNVDDDNYPDRERSDDPLAVSMALAMPHQLRDRVPARGEVADSCGNPVLEPNQVAFGARLELAPTLSQPAIPERVSGDKLHELPFLRGVICERTDELGEVRRSPVTELSFGAPAAVREQAFPALSSVRDEEWGLLWEGRISTNDPNLARKGLVSVGGDDLIIEEGAAPFCAMGAEEFDIAAIVGCDPTRGNSQCGVGETCFVHPDSPSSITSGLCLPSSDLDAQAAACRELLISRRTYTVQDLSAGRLVLGERARSLRTTPLDGCASDAQCQELAEVDAELAIADHPVDANVDAGDHQWSCQPDPSRAPGPDRCLMVCEVDTDCEQGFLCGDGGVCVSGTVPEPSCRASIQRYEVRVGEAFALLGARTGFLHDRILDADTGECIADPDANPLEIGRVPLRPPACDGDEDPLTGPNPCSTTIEHSESYVPYDSGGASCQPGDVELRTREAPAIQIRNPAFTFHLVDTETQGDAVCRNDQMGDLPPFAAVYYGYQILFTVTGGFTPMLVDGVSAAYPIEVVTGPDGLVWVLDQGDVIDPRSQTSGRVYFFDPRTFGFATQVLL